MQLMKGKNQKTLSDIVQVFTDQNHWHLKIKNKWTLLNITDANN